MRRILAVLGLVAIVATSSGCLVPIYSADPIRRTNQLLYTSENLRMAIDDWERIWFLDQPAHTTPYRTHGGTGL
jgi:hypothetical protein